MAAREAACAVSERQLAAQMAQLSLHERLLQERTARVVALEHEVQVSKLLVRHTPLLNRCLAACAEQSRVQLIWRGSTDRGEPTLLNS